MLMKNAINNGSLENVNMMHSCGHSLNQRKVFETKPLWKFLTNIIV